MEKLGLAASVVALARDRTSLRKRRGVSTNWRFNELAKGKDAREREAALVKAAQKSGSKKRNRGCSTVARIANHHWLRGKTPSMLIISGDPQCQAGESPC
eukprot:4884390-Pyramimonas_sp.AAC.1